MDSSNAQTQISKISKLNPHAQEWNRPREEDRCLFITFSKHNAPIKAQDLTMYFEKKYGDCVQSVTMLRGNEGQESALCAKVIFKLSRTLFLATSGEMNFFVNGKSIWCKRYQPKKKQGPR
ncbi:hypothetical protein MTR_8g006200 [Medicago truncatula]|uniref:Uncharacterized protein n=1 Tax=Medicago truncatula TaxID=3880 RepID=G7LBL7_MEDTR|nr:hypothetical protein MTR_8g006200 [Medicago truncatula]